jgi:hypothetical protein
MATKKVVRPTEGEKPSKKGETRTVNTTTSEADVVRFEAEGATLVFAGGADFKVLPESIVDVLSHENARRYWMALGEHKATAKKGGVAPMLERIVDPLVGHEEARLSFTARGAEGVEFLKRNHLAWMFCTTANGFEQVGYSKVTAKDPVDVGISSNPSDYYLTKDTQGRDELILMKVDMAKHLQHDRAVAAISQQKVAGTRAQFEADIDKVGQGKVRPMPESEEDRTVERVRVGRDDVDRAFLSDK